MKLERIINVFHYLYPRTYINYNKGKLLKWQVENVYNPEVCVVSPPERAVYSAKVTASRL